MLLAYQIHHINILLNCKEEMRKQQILKVTNIMEKKKLYKQDSCYNLISLKMHLQDEGVLTIEDIQELITKFLLIQKNEPNYIKINGDTVIIGDIHGQYYDFLKILTKIGNIEENFRGNILFLGDYVDRGANSVEVITFIMALKINYPNNVFLLRGNHESRCMTMNYNFMREVVGKYNQNIYQRFIQAFDSLPLACLVNKNFFCVHGGISDKLIEASKINQIDRFKQIPLEGAFCDFIWSDPIQSEQGIMSQEVKFNDSRQCSIYFGKDLTKKFLQQNNVKSIIRGHEVFQEGYQRYGWVNKKDNVFPTVITVFSAPNYCGVYGNKGAIIKIEGTNFQIKQFKEQQINNKLHSYLQVFQWSIPQITRVVNDFTKAMMVSIFEVFLKDQFSKLKSATPEARLKVLLDYIKKHTDILQKQKNNISQSSLYFSRMSEQKNEDKEVDEKQRMFNRSRQYFKKTHQRPSKIEEDIVKE